MHSSRVDLNRYGANARPEHGSYKVMTKPPIITSDAKLNELRNAREQLITIEADKAARLKCHSANEAFTACLKRRPAGSSSDVCADVYSVFKTCVLQEVAIESDKRRRDTDRFPESWWTSSYTKDGETGEQAKVVEDSKLDGPLDFAHGMLDSFKGIILGGRC